MADAKLSIKEQLFCNEYIKNGGHGTNAVISAGYSPNGASVQSSRMLDKSRIQGELRRQNEFLLRANALSKNQIIEEQFQLYHLARADEQYKTASAILDSLTKLLGYAPQISNTKEINHNVKFERLLKDITPEKKVITDSYVDELMN